MKTVADPDQAFGEGNHIGGHKKDFTCLKSQVLGDIVGYHTKLLTCCRPRKWLVLLVKLCNLSGNHHSSKVLYY